VRRPAFFVCILLPLISLAQDKVVVIPLMGDGVSGNATPADVLDGKTFSNSSGTGLTGTRPPAPVGTDGIDYEHTIQPPDPRFSNIGTPFIAGYGAMDHMTGLIWQKYLDPGLHTHSEADEYCEGLETGGPLLQFTDWRLPAITELQSLINHTAWAPALPLAVRSDVFTDLDPWGDYWASTLVSTICPGGARGAFLRYINMGYGETNNLLTCPGGIVERKYAWCVRGPYYN
jgi:hypothetical protein